jgi:hypothetical protein
VIACAGFVVPPEQVILVNGAAGDFRWRSPTVRLRRDCAVESLTYLAARDRRASACTARRRHRRQRHAAGGTEAACDRVVDAA